MFTLATIIVGLGIGVSTFLGTADPACGGGGLGQWSVPINTILLLGLAVYQTKTKHRVEEVKAVTDTVKLRSTDEGGRDMETH